MLCSLLIALRLTAAEAMQAQSAINADPPESTASGSLSASPLSATKDLQAGVHSPPIVVQTTVATVPPLDHTPSVVATGTEVAHLPAVVEIGGALPLIPTCPFRPSLLAVKSATSRPTSDFTSISRRLALWAPSLL